MPDYESLLERIRISPLEHLGRRSVGEINPYIMGYDTARQFWGLPNVPRRLNIDAYRQWVESKVHLCNQDLQSFCRLLTQDEGSALDLFFTLYDAALDECKEELVDQTDLESKNFDPFTSAKSSTLVEFVLDDSMKTMPALYFGNGRRLSRLWALCSGFLWAERDLGIVDSSDAINMEMFQLWLDERYPIAKGQNWDKLFYFYRLDYETGALEQFYEDFEMFLEGKKHDTNPKWIDEAVKSVLEHSKKKSK